MSVDYNRDQGFLTGMGIDVKDKTVNGDEDATGSYSGGDYTIVCNEPTGGNADGGKTAMEACLAKNPDINVVYTINEPAAAGASSALEAAGTPRCADRLGRRRLRRCRATSSPASSAPLRSSTRCGWRSSASTRSPRSPAVAKSLP